MKINEIKEILNGRIICGEELGNTSVEYGFSADLLSDVLTLESENLLLITGLTNLQTIRTAEMADISCIVFARGKKVNREMLFLAERNSVVLMECCYSVFKASGLLFQAGLKPIY